MQQAPDLSPPVPTPAHTVAADAPAKINLTLGIKGRRRDGYHELRSLVIGVGLCDRLQWTKAATADWSLRCSDPALEGPSNLVERAAQRLAAQAGRVAAGRLSLTKRIPVGGGMGGGSSDAAAALRLLNEAWRTGLAPAALAALGAELGSDVPLFFDLPAAVITGRGEQVEPVQLAWRGWVLLIPVGELVSTAEVYAAWQPADRTKPADAELEREVCQATSAQALGPLLYNDLEAAVFRVAPAVARAWQATMALGMGPARVSGAGSVLYLLFDDEEAARAAACKVRESDIAGEAWVCPAPVDLPPLEQHEEQ